MMTDYRRLAQQLRETYPGLDVREQEPMSRHTTFHVGGCVSLFVRPTITEEVEGICRLLREQGEKPFIMGRGSNLLFGDADMDGVVLQLAENFSSCTRESETELYAQAGITMVRLAQLAQGYGLTGLEFAGGIPGALGGGIAMNAGAYGGELKDVLVTVDYLDEDLRCRSERAEDCDLRYRHSKFSDTGCVVLGARLRLEKSSEEAVKTRMEELKAKRTASQPLDFPSAGSTFKRPEGGYAVAMIDEAGLKGYTVGGAQVSPKHAGFVVNCGGATCEDVLRLMQDVQDRVYARTGIRLEPEVKIIRSLK